MNQAIRDQFEKEVNIALFFSLYYPEIEIPEPKEFFHTPEDEQDNTPSFGWTGLPIIKIKLGHAEYETTGNIFMDPDYEGDTEQPELELLKSADFKNKYKSWATIKLHEITPGWKNKYSEVDKYYEDALISLPVKP
jgi:hypothetical protein